MLYRRYVAECVGNSGKEVNEIGGTRNVYGNCLNDTDLKD